MSLKRILKRKEYQERGQPANHEQPLVKHKDYSKVAKSNNATKARLKKLTRAAALRNPDEFYYKMENAKIKGGKTIYNKEEKQYSTEELKHMVETDLSYTSLQRQREEKKINKMQANIHFLGIPVERKHTIFVDDLPSKQTFDPVEYFHTIPEAFERPYNVLPKTTLKAPLQMLPNAADGTKLASYEELQAHIKLSKQVKVMEAKLQATKQKMGKDAKNIIKTRRVGRVPVYKWKRQRNK